ncbi:hypothetical protein [Magnetospira sp. QH-2]|uniref:hypothetical protein n=1 Tax=Magnetospira sp. (strain QH-2) TaxID=1288970 RepID=UPI0003E80A8C|nr:hypothetical protein [Magnetospira sp. QH-2]CCQ72766.1 protein of unknown function [Magnetospira sp. QH-2]
MTADDRPPLGDTASNRAMRVVASLPSAVPFAGGVIQTAVTELIPNVRLERIEAYLLYLQGCIDELQLKAALETPEGLDTFEEGIWQAARAFNDERKQQIAELVAVGLKSDGTKQAAARHFLRILTQIDDRQIVLLSNYLPENLPQRSPAERVQQSYYVALSEGRSVKELNGLKEIDEGDPELQLNAAMIGHLSSFGLIEEDADLDNMGPPLVSRRFHLTPLGFDFLIFIGVGRA